MNLVRGEVFGRGLWSNMTMDELLEALKKAGLGAAFYAAFPMSDSSSDQYEL